MPERLLQLTFDETFNRSVPQDVTPEGFSGLTFPEQERVSRFVREVRESVTVHSPADVPIRGNVPPRGWQFGQRPLRAATCESIAQNQWQEALCAVPVIGVYIHMGVEGPHAIIGVHRGRGATLGYICVLLELCHQSVRRLSYQVKTACRPMLAGSF